VKVGVRFAKARGDEGGAKSGAEGGFINLRGTMEFAQDEAANPLEISVKKVVLFLKCAND